MPPILILCDQCTPGFRAGGPMRSLVGTVSLLANSFEPQVITGDRNLGGNESDPDVAVAEWNRCDDAEVFYLPPGPRSTRLLARLLNSTRQETPYLNYLFSGAFGIRPLLLCRFGLIARTPERFLKRRRFGERQVTSRPGRFQVGSRRLIADQDGTSPGERVEDHVTSGPLACPPMRMQR
jgi:hypothetical protein